MNNYYDMSDEKSLSVYDEKRGGSIKCLSQVMETALVKYVVNEQA